jgi:demethylmenaquinone methyltransferase/2-methoxy-6-polyprenyl-1,4-benzoquinol methylase
MNTDPYRNSAAWYDVLVEPFVAGVRRQGVKLCPPEKGLRVLEVGCGTGTNLLPFLGAGCQVFGLDLSPAMIARAKWKLDGRADLRVGDAASMPYAENRFDLIVAMFTLHEMPARIRPLVLREMVRVLKPEGRLLLIDYRTGPLRFPLGWFEKGIAFTFEFLAGGEHFKNYRDFITRKALPPMISAQRLEVIKAETTAGGNFALYVLGL